MFSKNKKPAVPPSAAANPQDLVAEAEARLQAAREEAQRLEYAPLPRAELLARIPAFVDACAAKYLAEDGLRLIQALSPYPDPCGAPFSSETRMTFGLWCALDRAGAIRTLTAPVQQLDYVEGPSAHDHARRVEEAKRAVAEAKRAVAEAIEARAREKEELTGIPRTQVMIEPASVAEARPITAPNIMHRPSDRVVVRTLHGCLVADD